MKLESLYSECTLFLSIVFIQDNSLNFLQALYLQRLLKFTARGISGLYFLFFLFFFFILNL